MAEARVREEGVASLGRLEEQENMALIVVGGSTRNIGKTSVVAGLIAALRGQNWTAIKITQYGHGICSADGKACECATADHTIAFTEERDRSGRSDSSRYLVAGAKRSLWVRTQQGELFEAMPRLRREIADAGNVIVESNSILQFVRPDVFLSVLDPAVEDFKRSARRYLDRADLILMTRRSGDVASWPESLRTVLQRSTVLYFEPETYVNDELVRFVEDKLCRSRAS